MSNCPYIIRNYQPSDFEDYVKLNLEVEKLKPMGRCISRQILSENLRRPNYSPEQDLFVVETASKIVGFIHIIPELITKRVLIDCLVHPEHRRRGLAKQLLTYALHRAKELKVTAARVSAKQGNATAKQVLSRLGFRAVRRLLELRLALDETCFSEVTHPNYSFRHLPPAEEDKLAQIQNRCFAGTWGYNPNTTEEIIYSLNLSHGSPEDVILICEGDKLVGYCWNKINCEVEAANGEQRGRIFMLGVDPDYRSRGIGKIALREGLAYLKNKGVRLVELEVDSENKVARTLYRSVGFKKWSSILWYEKAIN
jgi:mycothiol synthase